MSHDFATDGPFEFYDNGILVGKIECLETAIGNKQLVLSGVSGPAITIGGDRTAHDVQISPDPEDKPHAHLTARSTSMQGTYGDVWFDGSLNMMPAQVFLDGNGDPTIPLDPRGAINFGRTRYPGPNEDLGMIRLWRKSSTGAVEEKGRMGLTADGFPYSNNGGNDTPLIALRKDGDSTKLRWRRESDGKYGELSFDNSGKLKYTDPDGATTVLG